MPQPLPQDPVVVFGPNVSGTDALVSLEFWSHFVIVNEKVSEMDLIPDGAFGSRVTKAVWRRRPMRAGSFGMLMAALAWP